MDQNIRKNCNGNKDNSKCINCNVRLIAFCGILEDEDILQLESISKDRLISKGEDVFSQGDHVDTFYNIKSGSIKIYKLSTDGRKQIVGFLYPGDFLGMSSDQNYN